MKVVVASLFGGGFEESLIQEFPVLAGATQSHFVLAKFIATGQINRHLFNYIWARSY